MVFGSCDRQRHGSPSSKTPGQDVVDGGKGRNLGFGRPRTDCNRPHEGADCAKPEARARKPGCAWVALKSPVSTNGISVFSCDDARTVSRVSAQEAGSRVGGTGWISATQIFRCPRVIDDSHRDIEQHPGGLPRCRFFPVQRMHRDDHGVNRSPLPPPGPSCW